MRNCWILIGLFLIVSCRSSEKLYKNHPSPVDYSIIYVIHGDSNYLYHTIHGKPKQADLHAMKEARYVGRHARHGEVFIFHQNPEHKILWIFPRKDRKFLYYRNGRLVHQKRYSPHSNKKAFVTEAKLYHKYTQRAKSASARKIFIYMGHEVPIRFDYPYNFSRPKARFNTDIFVRGVKSFLPSGAPPFDLTVISTCNNGTPLMVHKLSPYTHYILASPQNLHLSYINTKVMASMLNKGKSTRQIADTMAARTYKRLSGFLETAITLSVYNTSRTKKYLPALAQKYHSHLKKLSEKELLDDNQDCTNLPFFHLPDHHPGVKTWYKPPAFGRKVRHRDQYSGWGCKN
ncbi:MAG TPA: hypothetical protein VE868_11335 [Balneolaceae bacterium]|nr:hypothetical protein [Balneolaceae bacterium]